MGRAFEFRKERKFKRWGNMARTFTRLGKEITIAAKTGGTDPAGNPRLRTIIQTAKSENMPKDNIERAIKRAVEKDQSDYKELVYEGYGPHGIAFLIETATDNPMRTVANVRSYFTKTGGSLGTSGSVDFMFDHKSVFKIKDDPSIDIEELELELIDFGADEVYREMSEEEEGSEEIPVIMIYGSFESFGAIQKFLEEKGYEIISGRFDRIPNVDLKTLPEDQRAENEKLIDLLENDDDVQNVYHIMNMEANQ
ncbi:MAG: YebC/PmpR family DNA-binding transcriptional regulator [Bacteroidales bacterium]|jgi:YebC/PmpR family DNA-binding regulatory protein|nr:YebC/PmpR family DNA-binding transcriptional regulator [Bacteroidales bacterium]